MGKLNFLEYKPKAHNLNVHKEDEYNKKSPSNHLGKVGKPRKNEPRKRKISTDSGKLVLYHYC